MQNRKKYLKAQQNYKHHFSLWQELDASQVLIVEHRTNGAQQIDHQGGRLVTLLFRNRQNHHIPLTQKVRFGVIHI